MGRATELVFILATGAMLSLGGVAEAQTWDAGANGNNRNWSNANNWSADTVPTTGGVVVIDGAGGDTQQPILNVDSADLASTTISDGSLRVDEILNSPVVTISDTGNLRVATNGQIRGTSTTDTAVSMTSSGTLTNNGTITGSLSVSNGTVDNAGIVTGSTSVSGGTMNLNTNSDLGDAAALTVSGGTLNVNVDETVGATTLSGSGTIAGTGTLTVATYDQSGGTLSGTVSSAGAKSLTGGTISGTLTGAGATTITAGTGSVNVSTGTISGDVTLASGTLVIGNSDAIGGSITTTGSVITYADGVNEASALIVNSDTTQLNVAGTDAATQSGVISELGGARPIEKTGTGTLTLSGVNTYTGATTVSAGTLNVTGTGSIASTTIDLTGGALVIDSGALDATAAVTVSGTNGALTVNGTQTVGDLDQTGGTINGNSTLTVDSVFTQSGGTTGGTVTINADGFEQSGGGTIGSDTTVAIGANAATLSGGTIDGALTGTGTVTVDSDTTTLKGTIASADIDIASNGILETDGGGLNTDAVISNEGELNLIDGGSETVDAVSGAGDIGLSTGSVLSLETGASNISGALSGEGTLAVIGTSTTSLSGDSTGFTGTVQVNAAGATLNIDSANALGSGGLDLDAGTATFNVDATLGGLDGSAGTTIGIGVGDTLTLNLPRDFDYNGDVNDGSGGTGGVLTLASTATGTQRLDGTVELTTINVNGGTLTLSGTNTIGQINVDDGRLRLESNGAAGGTSGQIVTTGSVISYGNLVNMATEITLNSPTTQLEVLGADTAEQSGVISETGGARPIEKTGTGTLTLSADNTYTGTTTVTGGTLIISGSIASTAATVGTGATLSVDGASILDSAAVTLNGTGNLTLTGNETIGSLASASSTSDVTLGANTLTINGDGDGTTTESFTFGGDIGGTGGVSKTGTDVLVLTGSNSFAGALTISGGVGTGVSVTGAGGTLATTSITINAGGAALATDGGALASGTAITNNSSFQLISGGDESIAQVDGTGQIILSSGSVLTLNSDTSDLDGVVGGLGGLTVAGGTTNLNAANSYTGTTTVTGGTLNLNNGAAIANTAAVVVNGGLVEVNGAETIGSLAGSGGTFDMNANTVIIAGDGDGTAGENTTYSGVITGTAGLTKTGDDQQTLAGNNTYTGDTTINGGTLVVTGGNAIVDTGNVIVGNGGTFTVAAAEAIANLSSSDTLTSTAVVNLNGSLTLGGAADTIFDGNIAGGSQLTYQGTGSLTLTGANAHTGTLLVNGATAEVFITGAGTTASTGLTVLSGGTLQTDGGALASNARLIVDASTATFTGSETVGALTNNGSTGFTGTINLNNAGTVLTLNGTANGGVSAVAGTVAGAGTLNVTGGTTTVEATGVVQTATTVGASGTVVNNGSMAAVNNAGTFDANAATTGALTNTGTSDITGGTTASVTNNAGTTDLDGATISGSVVNNAGTVTSVGTTSALSVINSATFEAEGTLDADVTNTASGTFNVTADLNGGAESFVNNGTLNVIDGSYTGLASLNNSGLVNITGRTLTATNGTNTGQIILTSGTIGGAFNNAGGAIRFSGASGLSSGSIAGGTLDGTNNGTDNTIGDTFTLSGGSVLSGGTTYFLNVNTSAQIADQIIVGAGSSLTGSHDFVFRDLSPVISLNTPTIIVLGDDDGYDFDFTVTDGSGNALPFGGTIVYDLSSDGAGNLALSQVTSQGVGGIAASVGLTQSLIGSVVNRPTSPFASGLAAEEGCSKGGFARGSFGQATIEGTSTSNNSTRDQSVNADYYGVQAGYDFGCNDGRFFDGWDAAFGGLVGYNSGSTDQPVFINTGLGTNSVASTTLSDFDQSYVGLYAVASRERLTADVQLRFDNTKFQLSEDVNPGFLGLGLSNEPEFDTDTVTFTARLSYQIPLNDNGLTFVPTGGFAYSSTSDASVTFDNGDLLELDSFTSTVGFIGATIAKQSVSEDGLSGQAFFGSLNYYNDFGDDRIATFTSGTRTEEITSTTIGGFGEASIGWNYVRILENGPAGAKQLNANIRADARFGGSVSESYSLTAQLRLSF